VSAQAVCHVLCAAAMFTCQPCLLALAGLLKQHHMSPNCTKHDLQKDIHNSRTVVSIHTQIAVPTSSGYGATLSGAAPMLSQLSCSVPGVYAWCTVVVLINSSS